MRIPVAGRLAAALTFASVLSVASVASAVEPPLPWWVAEEAAAEALREALSSLWPEHPVEVRVGDADPTIDGLHHEGGDLVLVLDGVEKRLTPGSDPAVQVTMVRARLRRRASERVPEVPEPVPEVPERVPEVAEEAAPAPEETDEYRPTRPRLFIAASAGGGGRIPGVGLKATGGRPPSLHLTARLGFEGRFWTFAACGGLRLGDHAGIASFDFDGEAVFLGGSGSMRAVTPPGVALEVEIAGGVRLITWSDRGEPVFKRRGILPAVDVAVRLWGPAVRGVSMGGGVRIEIDLRRVFVDSDEGSTRLVPVVPVIEFGVRIGAPSR